MLDKKPKLDLVTGNFDPVPMDTYTVQIADVDMKQRLNPFKGREENVLNYKFIILDDNEMGDGEGTTRGRFLWQSASLKLGIKTKLYAIAKAVFGRDLTDEEMEDFDARDLVGNQIRVTTNQTEKDGKIYTNITGFGKAKKLLEPIEVETKISEPVTKKTKSVLAEEEDDDNDEDDLEMEVAANASKKRLAEKKIAENNAKTAKPRSVETAESGVKRSKSFSIDDDDEE